MPDGFYSGYISQTNQNECKHGFTTTTAHCCILLACEEKLNVFSIEPLEGKRGRALEQSNQNAQTHGTLSFGLTVLECAQYSGKTIEDDYRHVEDSRVCSDSAIVSAAKQD